MPEFFIYSYQSIVSATVSGAPAATSVLFPDNDLGNQLSAENNATFTTGAIVGTKVSLTDTADFFVDITDLNDQQLNDVSSSQLLDSAASIGGQSFPAGSNIDVNYTYTLVNVNDPLDVLTIYTVGINPPGIFTGEGYPGFVSNKALKPNATYRITDDFTIGDVNYADLVVCFAAGTRILTAQGARPVEELKTGDLVATQDNGMQPIRWIGHRTVAGKGNLAPVRFAPGSIGNTAPLILSPQHRVLLKSSQAELFFGKSEVLATAKHLVNGTTIKQDPLDQVSYWHFACSEHEIVWAEGALCESLYLGPQALHAISPLARLELTQIFPDLSAAEVHEPARPFLNRHETLALADT